MPHLTHASAPRYFVATALLAVACSDATTASLSDPSTASGSVSCSAPSTLAVGQVVTGISGTQLCLAGTTSGAEFAFIPFNTSESPDAVTSATFTFNGTTAISSSSTSIASTTASLLGGAASSSRANRMSSFEAHLRASERAQLPQRMAGARAWRAARVAGGSVGGLKPRLSISASAGVGQLVSLNSNANDACTNGDYRAARIMAIGARSIVVADTSNPANGFTSADYVALAAQFGHAD